MAEKEISAREEAAGEERDQAVECRLAEIDEQVPTEDHIVQCPPELAVRFEQVRLKEPNAGAIPVLEPEAVLLLGEVPAARTGVACPQRGLLVDRLLGAR